MQQTRPSVATEGCGAPVGRGVRLLDAGALAGVADDGERQEQKKKQIPCGNDNKKSKGKSKGKSKSNSKGIGNGKSRSNSKGRSRCRSACGCDNKWAATYQARKRAERAI